MERIIKLSELEAAIDQAVAEARKISAGTPDSRVSAQDSDSLAVSVVLTDGRRIDRGMTDKAFALGALGKIPAHTLLLTQLKNSEQLVEKAGTELTVKGMKPKTVAGAHGIRLISAIEPQNDSDAKWDFLENIMIDLMGSAPTLDDKLYESMKSATETADVENKLAQADFYLYDSAPIAIDLYSRLQSMQATTAQLATMGATIAAEGMNPVTGNEVFDGTLAAPLVALMRGPHRVSRGWMVETGMPAKSGFGGGIVSVIPDMMGMAVYSPGLNEYGYSPRAAAIIKSVARQLQLNVYAGARVKVE